MKGERVCKQSGRIGTVTKRIGNCLWVRMDDDGTEWSGGMSYWKVLPPPPRTRCLTSRNGDDAAALRFIEGRLCVLRLSIFSPRSCWRSAPDPDSPTRRARRSRKPYPSGDSMKVARHHIDIIDIDYPHC